MLRVWRSDPQKTGLSEIEPGFRKETEIEESTMSMDQDVTSKKNTTVLTKAMAAKMSPLTWIIDSGATTYIAKDKDSLCDLDSSVRLPISVADDSEIKSEGVKLFSSLKTVILRT